VAITRTTRLHLLSDLQLNPQPAPLDVVSIPPIGTRPNRRSRRDASFSGGEDMSHARRPAILKGAPATLPSKWLRIP